MSGGVSAPMRVAYVSSTFDPTDGWGRYSRELVGAARTIGLDPVVITGSDAVVDGLDVGVVHRVLPPVPLRRWAAITQLARARHVRKALEACEVVHLLVEPYLPLVARAMAVSAPLVLTAHGTWAVRPFASPVAGTLHARALRRVDLLVCQSAATREAMARVANLPPHVVLPGGVTIVAHASEPAVPKPPLPLTPPGPVVLTVGAVKRRKGHDRALEALARAAEQSGPLHWIVVGATDADPAWFAQLAARAASASPRVTVHWLGRVDEDSLRDWYRCASLFLLLPVEHGGAFEGLGLVLLEAASEGLPAITWRGSGAAEAVVPDRTGVVVDRGDVAAAAAAIVGLLADDARRARMADAARVFAGERSWVRLVTALSGHYQRLRAARHA